MRAEPERSASDEGFTLIEVLVAISILMVVMVAVLPQVVIGLRGAAVADSMTAAKGIVAAQLERMRNLPWHIAPSAELRIDVLDRYYPNLVAPTAASVGCLTAAGQPAVPADSWKGFVSSTATRCSYEPQSGPFFRTVEVIDPDGPGVYTVVTDAQFLTSQAVVSGSYGPAIAPITAGYDSTVGGSDNPMSAEIGVTVTAFDTRAGRQMKPFTTYTQITDDLRSRQRISAVAAATALQVSGVSHEDKSVSVGAGQVDLSAFLGRLSTASAQLTAMAARYSTTDPQGLAVGPVSAPPTMTKPAVTGTAGMLNGTCDFACWDVPSTSTVTTTATSGLPGAGTSSAPAQAAVTGGTSPALTFSNTTVANRPLYFRTIASDLALDPSQPLLSVAPGSTSLSFCGGGGGGSLAGRGYVTSTATTVSGCAEAGASTVSLFRRTGSTTPVLKLTLEYARLSCSVTPTSNTVGTATGAFKLQVDVAGINGNVSRSFTETSSNSDLQSLLTTQVTSTKTLGDYVKSWTLGMVVKPSPMTNSVSASLPGVLTLVSQPMRNVEPYTTDDATYTRDESSGITLTLGTATCSTVDTR